MAALSPDAASPPVPPPADAAVQLEEGVSVSPGPKWDDRRLFGALGFHADNEDGGGCGTVVMVRPENGTVVVLWDYGAVHTYAASVEGHATNVLSVHSRPTVQRDIMLLRACLRLFERSLKSRAQDAKWVGSGNHDEYHRKRWHASVAAAQSPDVFKALITSLEGGFERGSTTLMWQACLRVQWTRFDPLDVPPGTEPGSPLVLRRLATWLLGLPAAFSTPYYVLEWDFEDRPVWRHALLNLVGGVPFPFLAPNRHAQLQNALKALRQLEVMLGETEIGGSDQGLRNDAGPPRLASRGSPLRAPAPPASASGAPTVHAPRRAAWLKSTYKARTLDDALKCLESLVQLFKEGVSFPDWELYRREAWMVHVRLLQDAVGGVTEEAGDPQDAEARLPLTIQAALHAGGPPLREAIKEAVEGGEVEGSEADVAARVAALEESEYADPQWAEVHAGLIAELCGLLLTLGGELIGTEQWVSVWAPSFATLGASTKELQIPVYSSQHTAELLGPCASRVAWKCDATAHCSLAFSGFSVDHFRSLKKIADT
ncbi:unnamed protein product, partial [Symbiodinium sp. KB8]